MIISFEFRNHKSYRSEQSLNLVRPDNIRLFRDAIIFGNDRVSRVSAIYGSNASGKTAIIEALKFVQSALDRGSCQFVPFLLDRGSTLSESEYSFVFIATDEKKYQYDLYCDYSGVKEEKLYVYNSQKPSRIFSRVTRRGEAEIEFGPSFTSKNIRDIIERKEASIQNRTLFLSYLKNLEEKVSKPAYDFFLKGLIFSNTSSIEKAYADACNRAYQDEGYADLLNIALPAIDFGISEVRPSAPTKEDLEMFVKMAEKYGVHQDEETLKREYVRQNTKINFMHSAEGGKVVSLGEYQESRGTIATVVLLSYFYDALKNGGVCIVDEIDSSLHPLLVRQMVQIFNDKRTNPKGAQLIFTTHDVSLIESYDGEDLLDRDQIWFIEKRLGESTLYSLLDIDEGTPRAGSNIGLKYLHGRYGAVPNISLYERMLRTNGIKEG